MVIRNLRIERGWSQEQLAEISGVSTRTIQRIERGGKASLESLKCLAAVFETPIPDLQKDTDMTDEKQNLSDDDRAALKYMHFLKTYDNNYKKKAEQFDLTLGVYLAVMLFLLVINLLTSPGYFWVIWAAMGWGIAIAIEAIGVFGFRTAIGEEWERNQIKKRLRNL